MQIQICNISNKNGNLQNINKTDNDIEPGTMSRYEQDTKTNVGSRNENLVKNISHNVDI